MINPLIWQIPLGLLVTGALTLFALRHRAVRDMAYYRQDREGGVDPEKILDRYDEMVKVCENYFIHPSEFGFENHRDMHDKAVEALKADIDKRRKDRTERLGEVWNNKYTYSADYINTKLLIIEIERQLGNQLINLQKLTARNVDGGFLVGTQKPTL